MRKSNVEHWFKALEDGSQDLQIFSPRRDGLMEFRGVYIPVLWVRTHASCYGRGSEIGRMDNLQILILL